jgi:hypothetical protein
MGEIVGRVVGVVWDAVEVALKKRKDFREALADSFEEAARKIRSGELMVDDAVERARADKERIDKLRDKFKG